MNPICVIISVLFNFKCCSLLLAEKTFHIYFFIVFFFNFARKSSAPFIEILFPHEKFLHGKIHSRNSLISTSPRSFPQQKKIPLKKSVHFPITITIRKHWSKFVTCSPSHWDCGGVSRLQRYSCQVFHYSE